jgi:hypothetical protein
MCDREDRQEVRLNGHSPGHQQATVKDWERPLDVDVTSIGAMQIGI